MFFFIKHCFIGHCLGHRAVYWIRTSWRGW